MTVKPVFEVPWERSGVIAPGLPILPHGIERHPVPGGGSHQSRILTRETDTGTTMTTNGPRLLSTDQEGEDRTHGDSRANGDE